MNIANRMLEDLRKCLRWLVVLMLLLAFIGGCAYSTGQDKIGVICVALFTLCCVPLYIWSRNIDALEDSRYWSEK